MSHFTVLVTNTDQEPVEHQLERFNEQGDDHDYFMEWNDQTKEFKDTYENGTVKEFYPTAISITKEFFEQLKAAEVGAILDYNVDKEAHDGWRSYKVNDKYAGYDHNDNKQDDRINFEVERVLETTGQNKDVCGADGKIRVRKIEAPREIPMKEKYPDYETYLKDYHGVEPETQGYYHNPDAQWDWWTIGGRWSGYFTKKPGAEGEIGEPGVMMQAVTDPTLADVIKVKDIDWDAMDKSVKESRGEFYDEYKAAPQDKKPFVWEAGHVEQLNTMTREEYINRPISHATFAVLHDDEWYEKGSMGWWGIVSDPKEQDQWDEEFRKLIESLDTEAEVTIVDCHI